MTVFCMADTKWRKNQQEPESQIELNLEIFVTLFQTFKINLILFLVVSIKDTKNNSYNRV